MTTRGKGRPRAALLTSVYRTGYNKMTWGTFAGWRSNTSDVKCGLPKGSVLDPMLFLLHIAEVTVIAHRHSVGVHTYADNKQLHIHRKATDLESSIHLLVWCTDEINGWMSAIRLKLNTDKTQFTQLSTRQQLVEVKRKSISIDGVDIPFSDDVTCLGVGFDNVLMAFIVYSNWILFWHTVSVCLCDANILLLPRHQRLSIDFICICICVCMYLYVYLHIYIYIYIYIYMYM